MKNNLHVLITDMMNKAHLHNEPNPTLFMAEYLLTEAGVTMDDFLSKKNLRLQQDIDDLEKEGTALKTEVDKLRATYAALEQLCQQL